MASQSSKCDELSKFARSLLQKFEKVGSTMAAIIIEKVQKAVAVFNSISDIDHKTIEVNDSWTHIRAIDKDGDMYEITFTPKRVSE